MKTGKILPHSGSVLNDIEGRGFSVITDKGKGMIAGREWQEAYLKDAMKESAKLIEKAEARWK